MRLPTVIITMISAVFLMGATSNAKLSKDINSFSVLNLQKGETLKIAYASNGCFHSDLGVIDFSFDSVTYLKETKPLLLEQAEQLDNYFKALFNVQGTSGGCTTAETLRLTVSRDGEPTAFMSLVDDFCFSFLSSKPGEKMMSPTRLKYMLFKKEGVEQLSLKPQK